MQLITVQEYARRNNRSPQSVYARIRRGTIKVVIEKVEKIMIPVEDTQNDPV